MSDFVIDIQHLGRSFGKTQALQDVSLQVPRGGVFGLIGNASVFLNDRIHSACPHQLTFSICKEWCFRNYCG